MPPFRNPFGKKPPNVNGITPDQDENIPPTRPNGLLNQGKDGTTASRTSSTLSIKPNKDEPNEFKLSVVNDSGIYLPPSPPDKKSFWHRTPTSTTTSSHRSMLSETEPFSISRESFESYRRSFDISAKSPVFQPELSTRQSLDSRSSRLPRASINGSGSFEKPQPTDEETFEDVGLNDEAKPKKKGLFSRFGDSGETPALASDDGSRPSSSHRGFHIPGRKRGQSGQGAELGHMNGQTKEPVGDGIVR
ncbi:hypothetical protein MMC09_001332 [Bachmanniomyces sp. S44760]|nr:hypothetical protein [Bachmanniomyces sp. S44760]